MKKILWCAGAIGVFALILIVVGLSNPDNSVVAISHGTSRDYEEMRLTRRNGTYEQLLKLKDGRIVSNSGTWSRAEDDPISQSFASQTGTSIKNTLNYKGTLSPGGEDGKFVKLAMAIEPPSFSGEPSEQDLKTATQWRAIAKPVSPLEITKNYAKEK